MARNNRRFRPHPIAAAAMAAIGLASAQAATITWDAGAGAAQSFWDLATNWSGDTLPGAADDVLLQAFNTTFRSGTVAIQSFNGTGTLSVTGGQLSVSNASSIGSLTMSQGSLGGAGNITVAGAATLTFGDMRGTGTTFLQAATTLGGSGFRLDGGRVVQNSGTITWTAGQILFNNTFNGASGGAGSGTINNAVGATFIASGDSPTSIAASNFGGVDTGADAVINNAGTFRKSGSQATATTTVDVIFNNTGTVQAQTGILNLTNGGTHTGNFDVTAGAVLGFGGGTHNINAGTVTSPGTVRVSGTAIVNLNTGYSIAGTTEVQGGNLNVLGGNATTGSLVQSQGSIGGTGNLTVTGAATLTFGDHRGTGTTILQGATTLGGSGFRLDGGRVLRNEGTFTWAAGQFLFNNTFNGVSGGAGSGTINNAAGATFIASGDSPTSITSSNFGGVDTGADAVINNAGTFRKAGSQATAVTTVDVAFNNSGTVQAQTGVLNLTNGGTHTGNFDVAAGAVLGFGGGTHNINAGTVTSPGTVRVSGLTVVNVNTGYSIAGITEVQNGSLNFVGGNATTGALVQSQGSVGGTSNLTVTGPATITFGDHRGTGTTILQGATTISTSGFRLDGGRVLRNEGTVTWTAGQLLFNNTFNGVSGGAGSGTINNVAGGTFIASGDAPTSIAASNFGGVDTGADAVINNAGTFRKAGSQATAVTTVDVAFNNSGTVQAQTGVLNLTNGGTHTGNFDVAAGAVLGFGGGTHNINAGTVTSPGTVRVSGLAVVNVNTGYSIAGITEVQNGSLNFVGGNATTGALVQSQGSVGGTSNLTVTGPATITFGDHRGTGTTILQGATTISTSGFRLDGGRVLRNEGTITWTAGQLLFNNTFNGASGGAGSGTINNVAGGTFIASGDAATSIAASNFGGADTGADAVFNNAGTFRKAGSGSANVTNVAVTFNNTGTIDVQTGQLQFGSGSVLTHSGAVTVAAGAVLDFAAPAATTHTINTASTTIAGTLSITGDNQLNFTTAHAIGGTGTFQHNFGQVFGANLTLGPTLNAIFTDASHVGTGTTLLQGTGAISGTGLRLDGGRIFRNEGSIAQSGNVDMNSRRVGTAQAGNGTVVNASGATWTSNVTSGTNFIFTTNQGVGDTGAGAVFTNQGTFNKLGPGITDVRTALTNTGTLSVQAGQLQFSTGGALTSSGVLTIAAGGILDFASAAGIANTISAASTTVNGTLSITGDNTLNFTTAHSITGSGTFQHNFGLVSGADLTLTPTITAVFTDASHVGPGTTLLQGTGTISGTGLRLDGGRIFRNEGSVTQSGNVDMNSRRAGTAEAGNGTVVNVAGATWTSNVTSGTNFIFTTNQGVGDTGAGAVFTNLGVFNKLGLGITDVRTALTNTGTLSVQAGQLQFSTGGALTSSGVLTIAGGGVLDFASAAGITSTISAASTTVNGTLSITGDNTLNFATAHTIAGSGTFQHNFGLVSGADLTLAPTITAVFTDASHVGSGTTLLQGSSTISGTGLRLDGGRIFRNEGTVTQSGNIDMNSRRAGTAQAGNGTVVNAAGATWNSSVSAGTNFILTTNQGVGDTGAGAVFTNAGTFNKLGVGSTEFRTGLANSGLVDVQAGLLNLTLGTTGTTGTLRTSGGNVTIGATSSTGNLFHNTSAANSLSLGAQTITVFGDYNNASFGTGNAFNRRANVAVTGTGARLLAGGDVNQGITGLGVSNGSTATPSIVVGNVHVGTTTYTYNIANTGTTGASLRGAVQDGVNGGNITDARLSGNGVVASNFGPIAPGQSESRAITVTIGSAGVYTPISGQAVNILNNFENTRSQLLTITSAAGAGAYNLAAAAITPNPVALANQRVGGTAAAALTITNTAPVGAFAEGLNAAFGTLTGAALGNGGAVNLLAGGATNNSAMAVRLDGSSAGAKSGTVQVNLASDGTGTSGLGITALAPQTITVSGNFYNAAVGAATPSPITIANQRVGGTGSQLLTVSNSAAAGAFSEALNATFSGATGTATNNGGSFANLIAGGSNGTAMSVGVNTASAGAKSGTVTLAYQSDGTGPNGNSGLAAIAAGSQTIAVSGNVYQLAAGQLNTAPLNFGTVQVGQSVSQALSITNSATGATGFVEDLNVRFGASSGTGAAQISGTGSITGLSAGATNASALTVGVNTASAGTINGAIAVNYFSAGTVGGASNGLAEVAVGSSNYGVSGVIQTVGQVINQAAPVLNTPTINLGNVRVGSASPTQFVSISNQATTAPQAALNASISATAPITASGSFNLLAPGATNNNTLQVGMSTASAGAVSGQATIALVSDANNVGNCAPNCQITLTSQNVGVTGNVFRLATGAATPTPIAFGNVRIGGAAQQVLSVANTAANDGFSERLNAAFGTSTGSAVTTAGTVSQLQAGAPASNAMSVTLNTGSAGAKTGTVTLNYASDGTGTTGAPAIANGSQTINFSGGVYQVAQPSFAATSFNLGNVRVGGTAQAGVSLANTQNAPAGFQEGLSATIGGVVGGITASGTIANLAAGNTAANSLLVALNTSTAGAKSGSATVSLTSTGAGTSGLADLALPSQAITASGNVYQLAAGQLNTAPLNFGTVQVGQSVSQVLSITNSATGATGFVEDLNVRFGAASGTGAAQISGTGSITGLVAGGTNTSALTVNVNTGTAGTINGAIALNYFSAGTVGGASNGLGELGVGSASYGVTGLIGNVIAQAAPVLNTPSINLGNVRIGSTSPTQFVSLTNQSVGNPQAALNASISANAPITASGSFSLLAPGATNNSSLQVGMSTAAAGAVSGTATIALVSDASNVGGCAPNCQLTLASQNVNVTGNVFRLATGAATPTPIAFGNVRIGGAAQQVLAVTNTAANDGFSERLNAAFGASAGSAVTTSGSVTQLTTGAGADNGMSVTLNTVTAGAKTGTVTLNYASDGTGTTGAPAIANGSQTINFSGGVYQVAQPSFAATNFNLGNVRVGGTAQAAVGVTNTQNAPTGFQEGLSASIGGATGGITAGGSITNLAAGGTAAGSLLVALNTTTAGAKSGSATVTLASTGVGTSGLADLALPSQAITASGNVYQVAAGQLNTAALNFGTVQVGQSVSQMLSITNSATGATGFVEDLNVRFGPASGTGAAQISGTGSITGLVAGGTNNSALTVSVNTATVGTINGAIAVNYFSAGAVGGTSNGLGELAVGSSSYGVTGVIGNVIAQAAPVLNTPSINLGNVRIGSTSPTQFVSLTNQSVGNPQAALNASISANAPITASGSFDLLAPGATNNSSLQVGMSTASAGAVSGQATIALVSDASNVGGCAPNCQLTLASKTVDVTGAVYRLASPSITSDPISLAARVGDLAPTASIAVTNVSPDVFTERLNASIGAGPSGFTTSGSISGLVAGASSSALGVALNTSTAGTFGGQAGVAFVSSGVGTTNAADLGLGTQNVALSGRVYAPAVAQLNTTSVDFGIVHKGDTVAARTVSVTNAAAPVALNDDLRGSFGGATGPFAASGTLVGVAAGATDAASFVVSLNTANAGVFNGSASAAFVSHNAELVDLGLGAAAVTLKGQVNNFAELALGKVSGSGALAHSGSTYTLDFGTVQFGSLDLGAGLAILNGAAGPADLLSGSFTIGTGTGFTLGGFDSFAGIAAGASLAGLTVGFGTGVLGEFTQTITIAASGSNASGFVGVLGDTTLVLHGNVVAVPEPATYLLYASGLLALWFVSRRRLRDATRR